MVDELMFPLGEESSSKAVSKILSELHSGKKSRVSRLIKKMVSSHDPLMKQVRPMQINEMMRRINER